MAAVAYAVHSSITTPELPPILYCFKLIAPQFIRGGSHETLYLVKQPTLPAEPNEQIEAILTT
jgi:hypothetical protein